MLLVCRKFKIAWWLIILAIYYIHSFCGQIRVEVSGAKTRAIFEDVFKKMVTAAQPIPGFRRVKGGNISEFSI